MSTESDEVVSRESSPDTSWSERDWQYLINDIKDRKVIPVVGEELYTIRGNGGAEVPLYRLAAERLALKLGVEPPPAGVQVRPLNEVVCAYLREEKTRGQEAEMEYVYSQLCTVVQDLNPQPSTQLLNIATINDFMLLVTTTPDDLLERALDQKRFGGIKGTSVLGFALKEVRTDLPKPYKPESLRPDEPPVVFHLFGRLAKWPDQFVLSDDDLLEFFLALQSLPSDQLPLLRDALEQYHLLFLGGALSDWLVRFLLRTANRRRLVEKKHYDVLVAGGTSAGSELLKFLKFFSPRTKLAPGGPGAFVEELYRRWRASRPVESEAAPVLPRIEPTARMPEGSFFISYASEDREEVRTVKAQLDAAGVVAWFDREQLQTGQDWNFEIRRNAAACSFFVPIISRNTQRILQNAYFRAEWYEADQIAKATYAGLQYILPVLLEQIPPGELAVPETFLAKEAIVAPQGSLPPAVVKRWKELSEERKANPVRRPVRR